MRLFILSIFLLAVQAVAYVSRLPQGRTERTCDTPPPSAEILKAHKKMRLQPRYGQSIDVAAYLHVIRSPEKEKWVTQDMVAKQVCNLPTRLTFPYSCHLDPCFESGLRAPWDYFPVSQS